MKKCKLAAQTMHNIVSIQGNVGKSKHKNVEKVWEKSFN